MPLGLTCDGPFVYVLCHRVKISFSVSKSARLSTQGGPGILFVSVLWFLIAFASISVASLVGFPIMLFSGVLFDSFNLACCSLACSLTAKV